MKTTQLNCLKQTLLYFFVPFFLNFVSLNTNAQTPATALNFDGVNDYIQTNLNTTVSNSITFQTWFKTTVNTGQIAKLTGPVDEGFELGINTNGTVALNAYLGGWVNANSTVSINIIDGNWHQVTVSISGITASIYIDGVFQSSVTGTSTFNQTLAELYIGTNNLVGNLYFTGSIDEVRLWNTGLCQSQIQNNLNCELSGTPGGLFVYYKLNQGFINQNNLTETITYDSSGNSKIGSLIGFTLTGTTSNWDAGIINTTCSSGPNSITNTSICSTDFPFVWNGLTFIAAGTQTATLTNAAGCDSLATLNLTVNATSSSTTNISTCFNQLPFVWNGLTFFVAGTQTATLTNSVGCDSLTTLNLNVNIESSSTTTISVCSNQLPYIWNGLTFTTTSRQTASFTNANGCDSLASLLLIINQTPEVNSINNQILCNGTSTNTVSFNSPKILGNLYSVESNSAKVYSFPAGSFQANNEILATLSGSTVTGLNSIAFDASTSQYYVIVKLSVGQRRLGIIDPITGVITDKGSLGDNFSSITITPNGKMYGVTGNGASVPKSLYLINKVNATKTFIRTIGTGGVGEVICFNPQDGFIYHWSGNGETFYDKMDTTNFNLTSITSHINLLGNGEVFGAIFDYSTNGFLITKIQSDVESWVATGPKIKIGNTQNSSNVNIFIRSFSPAPTNINYNWTNSNTSTGLAANGTGNISSFISSNLNQIPDSSIITITPNFSFVSNTCIGTPKIFVIRVNPVKTSTDNLSICTNQIPFLWNGLTFNSAGTQTATLTAANEYGCDSLATLILTVHDTSSSTTNLSICSTDFPFVWNGLTFNAAGSQIATLINSVGCDSLATLNLTVNALPTSVVSGDTTICSGNSTIISVALTGAQPWNITSTNGTTAININGITSSPYTYSVSTAATYSVTAVSDANCTGTSTTGSAIVVVNPLPTATISGNATVCKDATAPLITFTGADGIAPYTFTYHINGGSSLTVTTTTGNAVTIAAPTSIAGTFTYYLENVQDASANSCSQNQIDSAIVVVVGHPLITQVGPSTYCDGATTVLTGSSLNSTGNTYVWLKDGMVIGGATSSQYSVFTSGSYTIEITNAICGALTSVVPFIATVNPIAVINPISNQTLCNGGATIVVNISSPTPIAPGAILTFAWTGDTAIGLVDGSGATIPSFNAINLGATQITSTITITPTYVNNGVSCVGTARTYTITINPTITASVNITTSASPICSGASITFTATPINGGAVPTYQWFNNTVSIFGATSSTYTATFNTADNIHVLMTSNHVGPCLTASPSSNVISVVITANNTVTAGTTASLCRNTTLTAITHTTTGATGIGTATGLPAGTIAGFGVNTISISGTPTTTGTFNYKIPLTGGCGTDTARGTIIVNVLPTAVVSGGGLVCVGATLPNVSIELTGAAPWSIIYTVGLTPTTVLGIVVSPYVITGATAGNYSVTAVSDTNTCVDTSITGSAVVLVNPLPTAIVTGTVAVCAGSAAINVTFTGSNGTAPYTFTYKINSGSSLTVTTITGNAVTVVVPTSTAGTYAYNLLSVQDASSTTCSQTQSGAAIITVVDLPTITPSGAATFCFTGNLVLTASSGTSYQWNLNGNPIIGAFNQTYTVYTAGAYSVTVNNAACGTNTSASTTVSVNLYVTPFVSISSSATTICAGTNVTFTATVSNTNGGSVNYDFMVDGLSVQNGTSNNFVSNGLTNGQVVTCTIIVNGGTCLTATTANSNSVAMTVNTLPTSVVSGDTSICAGATTPVTVNLTGTAPWSITYSDGTTPTTVTGIASSPYTIIAATAGTYTVTSVSDAYCTGTSMIGSAIVLVNQRPTATISGTTAVCLSATAPNVTFTGGAGTAPYTFIYNIGGAPTSVTTITGNSVNTAQPTITTGTFVYNLASVIDATSCFQNQFGSATIVVNPLPTVTCAPNSSTCSNTAAFSLVGGLPIGGTYAGNGVSAGIFNPATAGVGTHLITYSYTDGNSCTNSCTFTITVNTTSASTTNTTICANLLPFLWNGITFTTAGTQTTTLINSKGCDSLATLNLTVVAQVNSTTYLSVCPNVLPYTWNGLVFNAAGIQTKTFVGGSVTGCDSLATLNLSVGVIGVNNASQCFNSNNYLFNLNCLNLAASYIWNFGDGTTYTGATPPAKVFAQSGNYSIQLIERVGTIDTYYSLIITVNPLPVASFTTFANTGNGGSYTFQSTSTIASGNMNYSWTFGDGGTSTGIISPQHTYTSSGVKNVVLTVTSDAGCIHTSTVPVNVIITGTGGSGSGPLTIVAVTAQCLSNNNFSFGTTGVGSPSAYSWSFQDGTPSTSSVAAPTGIVFSSAGTKTVTLNYIIGAISYTTSISLVINPIPVSSFSYSNTSGNNYSFLNGSSISNSAALAYAWIFSNGATPLSSTAQNPTAVLSVGTTVATLVVTSGGCSASSSQNIIVAASAVTAPMATISFAGISPQCITGNSFTFGVNSTGGTIANYQWSIPNSTVTGGTTNAPTAVFTQPGTHNITLTVSNASGSSSSQFTITVLAIPNVTFYTSNSSNTYTFTPSTWVTNGTIAAYEWFVDNASQGVTTSATNLVQTLATGTYTIKLRVNTSTSCFAEYSQTITVSPVVIPPVSGISLTVGNQTQCLTGNSYTFSHNVTGGIASTYQWYFQNGTPSSANTAGPHTITFANAGTHTVQLYVTNSAGNSTATYNVTINDAPQPTVTTSGTTFFCSGNNVTLTSSAATSYQWYKDAVLIGGANAQTYTATIVGVYTVVVAYSNGCTSVANNGTTVTIVAAPSQPTITAGGVTTFCNGGSVTLTSSIGNSYQWYLNNMAISGATNSTYTASTVGAYSVSVTNGNGCVSIVSAATTVTINTAAATPTITASGATSFCTPGSVTLNSSVATTYQWYLNGTTISGATGANYIATTSGNYTVITGNGGTCPSLVSNTINVTANASPTAYYELYLNTTLTPTGPSNPLSRCFNATDDYSFRSLSTIGTGNITLAWSFGTSNITFRDGNAGNYVQPRILYNVGGAFNVVLTATGDNGCASTYSTAVTLSKPIAAFTPIATYSPNIFVNPIVTIVNNSSDASGSALNYSWSTTGTPSTALIGTTPAAYTYSVGGTKNITLTATSTLGCISVTTAPVSIVITPKAQISVNTSTADVPNPLPAVGTTNYTTYNVTAYHPSILANQTSIVTGSIANYTIKIEYSYLGGPLILHGTSTNTDINFSVVTAQEANYVFTITLVVTSNLGVTNTAMATLGNTSQHFTYRGTNSNIGVIKLPTLNMTRIEEMVLYPNPSKTFTIVSVKIPQNTSFVTVKVYNMYGKMVINQLQNVIANNTSQNFTLNVNSILAGTYGVLITDNNGKIIGKSKLVVAK